MSDLNQQIRLPFKASFKLTPISQISDSLLRQLNKAEREEMAGISSGKRRCEYATSRLAVKRLAQRWGISGSFEVLKDELGRPYGRSGEKHYHVSIAHTNQMVFCGIAEERALGIDLEPSDRTVSSGLRGRITHPREKDTLSHIEPIRLWTMKEALLKLEGQGLRRNMNEVCVQEENGRFFAEINNDKRAKICSFHAENYWLAIAFFSK